MTRALTISCLSPSCLATTVMMFHKIREPEPLTLGSCCIRTLVLDVLTHRPEYQWHTTHGHSPATVNQALTHQLQEKEPFHQRPTFWWMKVKGRTKTNVSWTLEFGCSFFQVEEVKKMKIGDPLDRSTDHGPQNHKAHLDKLVEYCQTGVKEGATLICGSKQIQRPGGTTEDW